MMEIHSEDGTFFMIFSLEWEIGKKLNENLFPTLWNEYLWTFHINYDNIRVLLHISALSLSRYHGFDSID